MNLAKRGVKPNTAGQMPLRQRAISLPLVGAGVGAIVPGLALLAISVLRFLRAHTAAGTSSG